MGQKSNPNSFQLKSKKTVFFGSSFYKGDYATLLQDQNSISTNLTFLFEKNKCFIKDIIFTSNNEKSFITIFISFLIWKSRKTSKTLTSKSINKSNNTFIQNLFSSLDKFGYNSSKRFIFQNLNKVILRDQNKSFSKGHIAITKKLQIFRNEPYFQTGLMLFCLMNNKKNTSFLFSKFIAKFFKAFHRTRKINKFLRFLTLFVKNISLKELKKNNIKGLKIQIKGRFSGSSRSKVRIFEKGQIPLQTIKYNVVYSLAHVHTSYGVFGIKVWVFE